MTGPKKIIYVRPGDMIEFRFIIDDDEALTASAWNDQLRPSKMLVRAFPGRIVAADPMVRFDNDFLE